MQLIKFHENLQALNQYVEKFPQIASNHRTNQIHGKAREFSSFLTEAKMANEYGDYNRANQSLRDANKLWQQIRCLLWEEQTTKEIVQCVGSIPLRLNNIITIGQLKDLIKIERENRLEEEKKNCKDHVILEYMANQTKNCARKVALNTVFSGIH